MVYHVVHTKRTHRWHKHFKYITWKFDWQSNEINLWKASNEFQLWFDPFFVSKTDILIEYPSVESVSHNSIISCQFIHILLNERRPSWDEFSICAPLISHVLRSNVNYRRIAWKWMLFIFKSLKYFRTNFNDEPHCYQNREHNV